MAAGVQQPSSSSSLATTPDAPEIGQPGGGAGEMG